VDDPEVVHAFEHGVGYNEDYSELMEQKFFYLAKSFDFHGKTYVIRTAFPYKYLNDLIQDTEFSFLGLISLVLILFSILTWLIINHFTKPIQQIIHAVAPYQEGKEATLPEIDLRLSPQDEFGKLALTLNSLSAKIQKHIDSLTIERNEKAKLLEMRKEFVANASHELKTPITIIRGFAEALHDNHDLPREITEEITGKIVKNCERMTSLIKDLLTLSDIENIPHSRLVECDLYEMAKNCCKMLLDAFPTAQIAIHKDPEEEMRLIADPSLIEMALRNLIENAAKYSVAPAQIDVSLKRIGNKIKLDIADKGIGIPAEDLDHIFERFYRVDKARSQKMGGFGLGLSIVQTIVRKHFGQISVASEQGKGTTFTILLPCILQQITE
jgi:signal transduction histidine kinase